MITASGEQLRGSWADVGERRAVRHVVVAPDKFKGSLPADRVAAHIAAGLRRAARSIEVAEIPVADGGDGTLAAALAAGFARVPVRVTGPTGEPVDASIGVRGRTAVVELALASGLALLPPDQLAPLTATSRGTGELIRAALDLDCTDILLGVGGSACTDGGAGLMQALGAVLLDADGGPIGPGGAALAALDRVDLNGLDPRLATAQVTLASDVDNPLLGPRGAARVYGPQKGANGADQDLLERGLARWVALLDVAVAERQGAGDRRDADVPARPGRSAAERPGDSAAERPGAGAAGGVGYAALAALGARFRPGVDVVIDFTGFGDALSGARLVITGEGSLDEQTAAGKAPAGVAARARAAGVPVIAVCGRCLLGPAELEAMGIARAYALIDREPDPARAIAHASDLLEQVAADIARDWLT